MSRISDDRMSTQQITWNTNSSWEIPAFIDDHKNDSVIRRLRIGHTYFTHGYLLIGEPVPECIPCASTLTVKQILIECVDFNETRNQFYTTNTLKEFFKKSTK